MIYNSLFGFKTKWLEGWVDFFWMVPVQGGPFSEAQGFMSELSLHLPLAREEFVVCQLLGQPCCAGSCRGFCAHQQLPQQESQNGLLSKTLHSYLGLLYSG